MGIAEVQHMTADEGIERAAEQPLPMLFVGWVERLGATLISKPT
jgi:hypothetical protein